MRRNELFTNTAVENEETSSATANENITLPDECMDEFIKAMKIGYYKEFYKQGLLTADQLEKLIEMQNEKQEEFTELAA